MIAAVVLSFSARTGLSSHVVIRSSWHRFLRASKDVPAVNFHDNFYVDAIPLVCIATEGASNEYTGSGTRYVLYAGENAEDSLGSACDLRACRACVSVLPDYKAISHTILGARCRDIPRQFPFKYRADVPRVRSQAAGVNSRRRFRARDLCHYLRERASTDIRHDRCARWTISRSIRRFMPQSRSNAFR